MTILILRVLQGYKRLVNQVVKANMSFSMRNIGNWRERLFTNIVLYATPISLLAVIPSVIYLFKHHYTFIPAAYLFALVTIPTIALNKQINLQYRQGYVVLVFYTLAILFIGFFGSFGYGSIYLLAISVFIAMLFSNTAVVWSVVVNILIFMGFEIVINFKLYNSLLIAKYAPGYWLMLSANFLFLNIAVVTIIRHVINGLEQAIKLEFLLTSNLKNQIAEKVALNTQLLESEEHYRSLFIHNPSPMWIFDTETLQFLQVNAAAIRRYGYTRAEFGKMTIKDIRPAKDIGKLLSMMKPADDPSTTISVVTHQRKNGQQFYAEVRCSNIPFRGRNGRLVIARDITEQMQYNQAIEAQNKQLKEIAFMQSHVVRAPLSRILALTNLLTTNTDKAIESEVLGYLQISANELDDVIKSIVDKTAPAKPVDPAA